MAHGLVCSLHLHNFKSSSSGQIDLVPSIVYMVDIVKWAFEDLDLNCGQNRNKKKNTWNI